MSYNQRCHNQTLVGMNCILSIATFSSNIFLSQPISYHNATPFNVSIFHQKTAQRTANMRSYFLQTSLNCFYKCKTVENSSRNRCITLLRVWVALKWTKFDWKHFAFVSRKVSLKHAVKARNQELFKCFMLMSACQHSSLKYRVSVDVFKNCVVYLHLLYCFLFYLFRLQKIIRFSIR